MNMTCIGFLVVFSCSALPVASNNLAFCDAYRPVFMAHSDTRKTKEQVAVNNAVYKSKCMETKK